MKQIHLLLLLCMTKIEVYQVDCYNLKGINIRMEINNENLRKFNQKCKQCDKWNGEWGCIMVDHPCNIAPRNTV